MKNIICICFFTTLVPAGFGQTHEWFSLPEEVNGAINCSIVYQGELVVAGGFTQVGSLLANNIAAWDGSSWSTLGTGFPSSGTSAIEDIIIQHDSLFVVGSEVDGGGLVISTKVAVWDGTDWSILGTGPNNIIKSIVSYNDEIHVAGMFDTIGAISAKGIAKWNGSDWESLGNGLRYNTNQSNVVDLYVYQNQLFATGIIDSAGNVECNDVALWNGANWSTIPSGSFLSFNDMYMIEWNSELLFGSFTAVSGSDLIAEVYRWNGTTFSTFSSEFMSYILDFEIYNGDLYCGGGNAADYGTTVREWNGSNWITVGTGLENDVHTLCSFNGELYAGGTFNTSNNSQHNFLARYSELNSMEELKNFNSLQVYPNPVKSNTIIQFKLSSNSAVIIDLLDIQGRFITRLENEHLQHGEQKMALNFENVNPGMYVLRCSVNSEESYLKLVKE